MPIFEYHCRECHNKFEKLVLGSDKEIACDNCRSRNLEKLFSTFGVQSGEPNSLSESMASGCSCTPASCGCRHN